MSTITTHVLDTAIGRPAEGVYVTLERVNEGSLVQMGAGTTNADGRITDLVEQAALQPGTYQLTFFVGDYLKAQSRPGFYPKVPVVFSITEASEHYHVPLLLNPYGYSTYRGS